MATHNIEAFSVSHAAFLNGTTGAEEAEGDLFGVRSASMAADIGSAQNTGDDAELSTWYWFNRATITVTSGFIPFDALSLATGTPIYDYADLAAYTAGTFAADTAAKTAARASAGHIFETELWTEQSMNIPTRPMLIRMPSKDSAGRVRLLDMVLYKVSFSPINFTGPTYKAFLETNFSATASMSSVDETGTSLGVLPDGRAIKSVGRLISRPG
jgi:hypothetical protein